MEFNRSTSGVTRAAEREAAASRVPDERGRRPTSRCRGYIFQKIELKVNL